MSDRSFLNWLHKAIPLTHAMSVDQIEFSKNRLTLGAPLEPNLNDKGTGFAGSISGLATLSGWCLLTLWLRERGIEADVMIASSEQRFIAPVQDRMVAFASLPEDDVIEQFWNRFKERGRARLPINVTLGHGTPLFELNGSYAAINRER